MLNEPICLWKTESEEYIRELEKVLDKIELIEDSELQRDLRYHILKCDDELTKLAEKKIKNSNK